ncbi:MAG TPA: hypothetical protein VGP35_12520 [Terriglobales bacterium]|jgi:hypothetical protein|nr:hypothetical protein [Terriglobales bacterium]
MTAAKKVTPVALTDAEKQLKTFIDKFEPKNQILIRSLRKALRKRLPTANELVYDNYNFFVIGYASTERPTDAILSIAAGANGVGMCFIRGASLPDPKKILLGSGKQTRFIRIESAKVLAITEVEALIAAATAQSKTPLPATGKRKLIIRSVSAKQRPRRRPPK